MKRQCWNSRHSRERAKRENASKCLPIATIITMMNLWIIHPTHLATLREAQMKKKINKSIRIYLRNNAWGRISFPLIPSLNLCQTPSWLGIKSTWCRILRLLSLMRRIRQATSWASLEPTGKTRTRPQGMCKHSQRIAYWGLMKVIRRTPTLEALLMRLTILWSWITDSASIGIPWISLRVSPMRVKRPGRLARCHLRSSMLHSCKMIFTLIS